MSVAKKLLLICLTAALVSGCVHRPVKHLASDAALIKPETSTKTDVLTYLGNPDSRQESGPGPEQWFYYGEERSSIGRTLGIGQWFKPKRVNRIIITFDGEAVSDIQYNASESGEFEQPDSETESE